MSEEPIIGPDHEIGQVIEVAIRAFKRVKFWNHALRRMRERRVTDQEVIATLGDPDSTRPSVVMPGRIEAFRNRTTFLQIKVVYFEEGDSLVVVTTATKKLRLSGRR